MLHCGYEATGYVYHFLLHCRLLKILQQSISVTLETVPDISEAEIISLLHEVASHHRKNTQHASGNDDAMQTDSKSPSSPPPLADFLSSCVLYNTSPAPLRVAIRQNFSDAEDIVAVLKVLDEWITNSNTMKLKLLPTTVIKNPKGVMVSKPNQGKKTDGPQLGDVCFSFFDAVGRFAY